MKKAVKNTRNKSADRITNCCSTSHKVWGAIALAGLFSCGLILGLVYKPVNDAPLALDAQQCDAIANEIVSITTNGETSENVNTLEELQNAYTAGCPGRLVIIEKPVISPRADTPEIISTCARIEQLLKVRLYPEDSPEYLAHLRNADTYSSLADRGCAENADMYKTLALREIEIATALQPEEDMKEADAEIVIDTFKKLDMQREAQAFLDKIQQLTSPAIDFILQWNKL